MTIALHGTGMVGQATAGRLHVIHRGGIETARGTQILLPTGCG